MNLAINVSGGEDPVRLDMETIDGMGRVKRKVRQKRDARHKERFLSTRGCVALSSGPDGPAPIGWGPVCVIAGRTTNWQPDEGISGVISAEEKVVVRVIGER